MNYQGIVGICTIFHDNPFNVFCLKQCGGTTFSFSTNDFCTTTIICLKIVFFFIAIKSHRDIKHTLISVSHQH